MKLFQICNQRELSHVLIINKKKKHTSKILIWTQNNICGTTVGRIIHSNLLLGGSVEIENNLSFHFAHMKVYTMFMVAMNSLKPKPALE